MGTALVVYRPPINWVAIAQYRSLRRQVEVARTRYYKLAAQVRDIANSYYEQDTRHAHVLDLRVSVRSATRGMPSREAHELQTDIAFMSAGTEQLFNGESEKLVSAYREAARLTHPDRGGDTELFQLVNSAYRLRDVTFLLEVSALAAHGHDLEWQQGPGLSWFRQELDRVAVSTSILRTTPEFEIVQAHRQGRVQHALALAQLRISELVITLTAELNHLLNGSNHGNNEEEVAGEGTGDAQHQDR